MMRLSGLGILKTVLSVLVFTFLSLNSQIVSACTCGGHPSTCSAYSSADAVFIGTVGKVQSSAIVGDDGNEYPNGQAAHIQVEKVFKGLKDTEVIFRTGGSSCDAFYEEGQRWLFYAYYNKEHKSWSIRACDRSTLIENAADDLLYLQGLPGSALKTRISGVLEHFEDDPVKRFSRVKNLIGAKVKIIGEQKTYEVYTDKNGVYEIYGLPPGNYAVEPEVPLGLKIRFPIYFGDVDRSRLGKLQLSLKAKSCSGVNYVYSADTSISGKVFGADGRVLPNVCVNVMPRDKPAAGNWSFDCTDENGSYKIDEIPPGEYVIVANHDGKISAYEPFTTAYYPGVFERGKATVLAITDGASLTDYDIHIPFQEARRLIQGVLLFSDGRPAAGEFVEFKAEKVGEKFDGEVHTTTDSQGHFSLPVLQGLSGSLRGFMYTYKGEFANCPQLDKLIDARGGHVPDVGTKPIKLEIDRDMEDVKLVFPFPYCVKIERN